MSRNPNNHQHMLYPYLLCCIALSSTFYKSSVHRNGITGMSDSEVGQGTGLKAILPQCRCTIEAMTNSGLTGVPSTPILRNLTTASTGQTTQ